METKFGSLAQYSSMDEVYQHLKKLYGQFTLNIITDIEDGVLTHFVSVRTLAAGKAIEAEAKGTGNITNVVKHAMVQLQLESLKIMNSKEVTGIPGVIKPIVRGSDKLIPEETCTEFFDFDDDSCDNHCSECGELLEDCICDDDLDKEEDESFLEKGKEIISGIKFVGTEFDIEKAKNEVVPGIRFTGVVEEGEKVLKAPPGFKLVPMTEEELKESTQKLCCTVASKKGYTFCPDCGTKLF